MEEDEEENGDEGEYEDEDEDGDEEEFSETVGFDDDDAISVGRDDEVVCAVVTDKDLDGESEDIDDKEAPITEQEKNNSFIDTITVLLFKVRSIVSTIKRANNIHIYVYQQIENEGLKKRSFLLDFHVRWNTTFLMINRFLKYKKIINDLTARPEAVNGIKFKQIEKLKKLDLSNKEWEMLETLLRILLPFYKTTKAISGQKYPTLSTAFAVKCILKNFLEGLSKDTQTYECKIKNILLEKFKYHFETKISKTQEEITMVILNVFLLI